MGLRRLYLHRRIVSAQCKSKHIDNRDANVLIRDVELQFVPS